MTWMNVHVHVHTYSMCTYKYTFCVQVALRVTGEEKKFKLVHVRTCIYLFPGPGSYNNSQMTSMAADVYRRSQYATCTSTCIVYV